MRLASGQCFLRTIYFVHMFFESTPGLLGENEVSDLPGMINMA